MVTFKYLTNKNTKHKNIFDIVFKINLTTKFLIKELIRQIQLAYFQTQSKTNNKCKLIVQSINFL